MYYCKLCNKELCISEDNMAMLQCPIYECSFCTTSEYLTYPANLPFSQYYIHIDNATSTIILEEFFVECENKFFHIMNQMGAKKTEVAINRKESNEDIVVFPLLDFSDYKKTINRISNLLIFM